MQKKECYISVVKQMAEPRKSFVLLLACLCVMSVWGEALHQRPLNGVSTSINDVKAYIQGCLDAGEKHIVVPAGTYTFNLKDFLPLTLRQLQDVTIDGSESHFICNENTRAIYMDGCTNVTLKNFSIDFNPLPFVQGRIEAVGTDTTHWIDIRIFEGYDIDRIALNNTELFDAHTLELKKNSSSIYQSYAYDNIEVDEVRRIVRVRKKSTAPDIFSETPGDLVVFTAKKPVQALGHTIYTDNSTRCTFENITLYSSPGFAFYEFGCNRTTYRRCNVVRKTDDAGVTFSRLRSGNSDGIDSRGAVVGPSITQCTILHNSDDCIAISGRFYIVVQETSRKMLVLTYLPMDVTAGDSLYIVAKDGTIRSNKVLSVTKSATTLIDKQLYEEALHAFDAINPSLADLFRGKSVYEFTLSETTNAQIGEVVYVKRRTGSDFYIANNTLGHTRARGMLIKASHGVIADNRIEGCQLPGISVAPELFYMEAGYAQDLHIINNDISHCNFGYSRWAWEQAGALTVVAQTVEKKFAVAGGFRNIRIENNRIIGAPRPSVVLTSIDGGYFKNNEVVSDEAMIRRNGYYLGVDNKVDVWGINNRNFILSPPTTSTSLPAMRQEHAGTVLITGINPCVVESGEKKITEVSIYLLSGQCMGRYATQPVSRYTVPLILLEETKGLVLLKVTLEDGQTMVLKYLVSHSSR